MANLCSFFLNLEDNLKPFHFRPCNKHLDQQGKEKNHVTKFLKYQYYIANKLNAKKILHLRKNSTFRWRYCSPCDKSNNTDENPLAWSDVHYFDEITAGTFLLPQ